VVNGREKGRAECRLCGAVVLRGAGAGFEDLRHVHYPSGMSSIRFFRRTSLRSTAVNVGRIFFVVWVVSNIVKQLGWYPFAAISMAYVLTLMTCLIALVLAGVPLTNSRPRG
jgi:hypothetical protein